MDKTTLLRQLEDANGRIMGYARLITKKTNDKEIWDLALQILSEAKELRKLMDKI